MWEYDVLFTTARSCHAPCVLLTQQAILTYYVSNKSSLLTIHAVLKELLLEQPHAQDALLLVHRTIMQTAC